MTGAAFRNGNTSLPFFIPSIFMTDQEAGIGHAPIPKTFTLARLQRRSQTSPLTS
jgi:hypothetical protein